MTLHKWVHDQPLVFLGSDQPFLKGPYRETPYIYIYICIPSTKKGGIYHGKPGFPKNTLKKSGIWSRGFIYIYTYTALLALVCVGITAPPPYPKSGSKKHQTEGLVKSGNPPVS